MAAVPMLLDSVYNGIISQAEEQGRTKALLRSVKLSNFLLKFKIDIRRFLFKDIMAKFGYCFPFISVGGAPVDGKKASFLASLGFDICIGYGLTEASPIVTLNCDVLKSPDSAGKCLPGCKIKIIEQDEDGIGEIAVKGKNVTKGYYKDPDANARSFKDGWFLTGDYGRLGKNGDLYIVGRKKNIIILDNGKNIYTEALEDHFVRNSGLITEAVVFATKKETPSGAVTCLAMTAAVTAENAGEQPANVIKEEVLKEVGRLNNTLPPYKRISEVVPFIGEFKKTSTMKIIRKDAEKIYYDQKN